MSVERFPLSWPVGWKRTPSGHRQRARFSKDVSVTRTDATGHATYASRKSQLNSADATARLQAELDRLGATAAVLSTNQELRLDGRPKSNLGEPSDTGAAVYFKLKSKDQCLACDRWDRVADNIAALAAHVDAIRRMDRYGVGSIEQAFAGYVGLPAKGQTWRTTLGLTLEQPVTRDDIDRAFRDRAREAHPDVAGGSHDAMASLTQARAEGLASLKG